MDKEKERDIAEIQAYDRHINKLYNHINEENKINWKHLKDEIPDTGSIVVLFTRWDIDGDISPLNGKFDIKLWESNEIFELYLECCRLNVKMSSTFWWVYACEFPWPV